MSEQTFYLENEEAQLHFGATLSHVCPSGTLIFLEGNLGAGKTTLVRGFLQGLGYQGKVKSPTYTLIEEYLIKNQHILHIDLYRLANSAQITELGIEELLTQNSIGLIEWPEYGLKGLLEPDITCYIAPRSNGREIRMVAKSTTGIELLQALTRKWQM